MLTRRGLRGGEGGQEELVQLHVLRVVLVKVRGEKILTAAVDPTWLEHACRRISMVSMVSTVSKVAA